MRRERDKEREREGAREGGREKAENLANLDHTLCT